MSEAVAKKVSKGQLRKAARGQRLVGSKQMRLVLGVAPPVKITVETTKSGKVKLAEDTK